MAEKRRVVVTGIGIISPVGNSVEESWKNILGGTSGIDKITKFDASLFSTNIAGEVRNFNPENFLEHKEVKKHDLFSQYSIAATQEAWNMSGVTTGSYDPHKMGCIIGVGIGGLTTLEKYHEAYLSGGPRKISPFLIPSMISNMSPGNIGIRFGTKGVNFTITSACTSATHAIGESFHMIQSGIQDCMITGGSESSITPIGVGGFCALKAMSTRNDEPTKASRPFDKDRDGFVMGEGSAVLILESLDGALKRGAKILAELVGYGASCDAYHMTAPSEDGEGAVSCMTKALEDSGLAPTDISYINAHGTSTQLNDQAETQGIKKVFGSWAKEGLLVSSTKSMTGHLLGAAGAIEAIFSVLSLRDQIVPPTINLDTPSENCDLDYVPHTARKTKVTAVASNSFGFGGTNATIIFKKYE